MANTFDGVNIPHPGMPRKEFPGVTTETVLLSGKRFVESTTEYGLHITLVCKTDSYTDISNLYAKIGTKGSLVLGTDTFTNMYIAPPISIVQLASNRWEYTVKFIKDTTS